MKNVYTELEDRLGATRFDGYEIVDEEVIVTAIVRDEEELTKIGVGEEALVFLSRTPFYAERGGQVGDTGLLLAEGTRFAVDDTIYPSGDLIGHRGKLLSGNLEVGK